MTYAICCEVNSAKSYHHWISEAYRPVFNLTSKYKLHIQLYQRKPVLELALQLTVILMNYPFKSFSQASQIFLNNGYLNTVYAVNLPYVLYSLWLHCKCMLCSERDLHTKTVKIRHKNATAQHDINDFWFDQQRHDLGEQGKKRCGIKHVKESVFLRPHFAFNTHVHV